MAKSTSKEIAVKQEAVPAVASDLGAWGDTGVNLKNIVIPRILMMQSGSKVVKDRSNDIGEGDFIISTTKEVIGSDREAFDIIPFHVEEKWGVYDASVTPKKWIRTEPYKGVDKPFEDKENGKPIANVYILDFYVMLAGRLELGPMILSFRSTSLRAGKQLYTQMFVTNRSAGLVPAAVTMKVTCEQVSNEKGTFMVTQVIPDRKATAEEIQECLKWLKPLKQGILRTDNRDIEQTDVTGTGEDDDTTYEGEF